MLVMVSSQPEELRFTYSEKVIFFDIMPAGITFFHPGMPFYSLTVQYLQHQFHSEH
jgi:hypothetical protein